MIQIRYDPEANAVYAKLRQAEGWIRTREIDSSRFVDIDETGEAVGVELLFVSDGVDLTGLPEAERAPSPNWRHRRRALPTGPDNS